MLKLIPVLLHGVVFIATFVEKESVRDGKEV